jgi:hypothetical protein
MKAHHSNVLVDLLYTINSGEPCELGLLPRTNFYLSAVKLTKQKGFGTFDIAGYWRRNYREK